MKRKTSALSIIIALQLVLLVFYFPSLATANPIPYSSEPNTESPTLEVISPKSGEFYDENSIELVFSVTKPDSWNFYWLGEEGLPVIGDYWVYVYLDGELNTQTYSPNIRDVHTTNYSIVLEELERGSHTTKIDLEPRTFYLNPDPGPKELDYFSYQLNPVSEMIQFRTTSYLTPSPTPTLTPNPSMGPKPDSLPYVFEILLILILAILAAIVFQLKRK